jgi:hemoglobin
MSSTARMAKTSPYEMIGGAAGVRRLADAFYDIMDADPAYRELREMHGTDLAPMREALAGFFSAWFGGPRDWIEGRGGFCIMSRHAKMNITETTAGQWMAAMRQAITQTNTPADLAPQLDQAFSRLAAAMV